MITSFDSTAASIEQQGLRNTLPAGERPMRMALVCDYLEEGWASMDLFGDMLFDCYRQNHATEVVAERLRPLLRSRFSRFASPTGSGTLWNADRLINRFWDYPRWLSKRAARFDLFHLVDHSYGQLALVLPPGRVVATCHDLDTFRCLVDPEQEPRPRWFRVMAEKTLRGFQRCAHVICVSTATKNQVLRHGLFPVDRITVIPPAVDPVFFTSSAVESSAGFPAVIGGAGQQYLLHVGSTIRRKRIDVLLRVFAAVRKEFPNMRLVRVGGAFSEEQSNLASSLKLDGAIVQCTHLTKTQLAAVYDNAAILLQTSDAEGFGLPVIEAMARGCPVVASDIASLREAGGSVAEYCAVADVEAWAGKVIGLLRERQASPGEWGARRLGVRRHASAFTWDENARQTISIYRRICGGQGQLCR